MTTIRLINNDELRIVSFKCSQHIYRLIFRAIIVESQFKIYRELAQGLCPIFDHDSNDISFVINGYDKG